MKIEIELTKLEKVQELINKLAENYDADHLGSIITEIGLTDIKISDIFKKEITNVKSFYEALSNLEDKLNEYNLIELDPEFKQALIDDFDELLE